MNIRKMKLALRYQKIIQYFLDTQPVAETELRYENPYQLAVAVILSAQCTDKRVNLITPVFFSRFPDARALSKAKAEDVFELIKSCSYPNNKTRNLMGMAKMLVKDFKGIMPSDVGELQKLPGVGRKTANVIAAVIFNKPAMAVDTHVHRVSARLGLTINAKNPLQTEIQLVRHIPPSLLPLAHHWLILHGRYVCQARKPKCTECGLRAYCLYFERNEEVKVVHNSGRKRPSLRG
jgi:endonuclease-3